MNIDIPEGQEPIGYVWGEMVPGIGLAAANFSLSVYEHTTLGLREFEAARLRIAQINGCLFCLDWRTDRDGQKVEEEFADAVTQWRTTDAFDDRARLAAEYAERYALDHHGLDDEFWTRMTAHYSQREIVELSMSIGSWLAFGLPTMCWVSTPCAYCAGTEAANSPSPRGRYRSAAMIVSMFRSASAVMVTKGFTLVLPGISEPSMT